MRYNKLFFKTLFWHQNKWHAHGILVHTLKVAWEVTKMGRLDLIPAAILHDIGKPFTAYHDKKDIKGGCVDASFTNHEEISFYIIKNWPVSRRTKRIVRYHYHIRAIKKSTRKRKHRQVEPSQERMG